EILRSAANASPSTAASLDESSCSRSGGRAPDDAQLAANLAATIGSGRGGRHHVPSAARLLAPRAIDLARARPALDNPHGVGHRARGDTGGGAGTCGSPPPGL